MNAWTSQDDARKKRFTEFMLAQQGFITRTLDSQIIKLRSTIAGLEGAIAWHNPDSNNGRKKIGKKRTEVIQFTGQLNALEYKRRLVSRTETFLNNQYEEMRKVPRVKDTYVSGDNLYVLTDTLYGKDYVGAWHKIGRLEISIDAVRPDPLRIRWINLDGPKDGFHCPPNITEYGAAGCMGTATLPLTSALNTRDWPTVVAIVVRYPECRGKDFGVIERWPVVIPREVPEWYLVTKFEELITT